jgi:hypothetical protein
LLQFGSLLRAHGNELLAMALRSAAGSAKNCADRIAASNQLQTMKSNP